MCIRDRHFQFVRPTLENAKDAIRNKNVMKLLERLLKLAIPSLITWLLLFYGLFHLWLNILAEITCFGDRLFYTHWWNAKRLDQYWRCWNIPVHNWLLRHVYFPVLGAGVGKTMAGLIVFIISAALHELIASGALNQLRVWIFMGMLFQLPAIMITSYLDKKIFKGKIVTIFGGGDSALDWAVELSKNSIVNLIHRRDEFRGAQATVDKVYELAKSGKINLLTKYQMTGVKGDEKIESIDIEHDNKETKNIKTDYVLGFFGLIMQLGPIANWGLNIDKKTIEVDTEKFETNQKGIYAVGDICSYPGKLKLILSGFHEGALAARACFKLARPNEKYRFEFTTSSKAIKDRLGVKGD